MAAASQPSLKEKIFAANEEAVARMNAADVYLIDIAPAEEVIPFFKGIKGVLHAGPPIAWKDMCEAMKGSLNLPVNPKIRNVCMYLYTQIVIILFFSCCRGYRGYGFTRGLGT
jgi:hypothetical protein